MKNEIDAKAAEWVAREDAADLSPEQQQSLQAWLQADPRHLGAYARMQAILLRCDRLYRGELEPTQPREQPQAATHLRGWRRTWRPRLLTAAASALLAVGVSLYLFNHSGDVRSTKLGEIAHITLDDGSQVTMNTESRIRVNFTAQRRDIELLRGEVLFDVAKDRQRPFVVSAGDTQVVAVGTSFQVRRSSGAVDVLVREGIVDLREPDSAPVPLTAGDKAQVTARAVLAISKVGAVDINRELAWRDGMISFSGQTLDEVAREFARYSDIHIRIADEDTGRLRVIGRFSATDPIGFSRAAAQSMGLDVSQDGRGISLRSRTEQKNR